MYGSGTRLLFERLPGFPGLTGAEASRTLSTIYAEIVAERLGATTVVTADLDERRAYLRRLASALESYAMFDSEDGVGDELRDGAAFVAAEALLLAATLYSGHRPRRLAYRLQHPQYFVLAEAGLLYLASGFDPNAAPCAGRIPARSIDTRGLESRFAEWACDVLRSLFFLRPARSRRRPRPPTEAEVVGSLHGSARAALFGELAEIVSAHLDWLGGGEGNPDAIAARSAEAQSLIVETQGSEHADIHHLLRLVEVVVARTATRGLRSVPPPPTVEPGRFEEYLASRARGDGGAWPRPLLWPPALKFVSEYMRGESSHAVVSAPTGSGKSGIAELAIATGLAGGWAIYLVPTNALANQIRNDLSTGLESLGEVQVRSFVGDAEYNLLTDETVTAEEAGAGTVVVMTPEKCALALRLRPDAFETCNVCVFDECHLLGDGVRGALAELVISHILALAPTCRLVLMSAMMGNPEELAQWLDTASGSTAIVVHDQWRPTRTLRAVLGVDHEGGQEAARDALERLEPRHTRIQTERLEAPHALLANLQGPWTSNNEADYAVLRMTTSTAVRITRARQIVSGGWANATTSVLSTHLVRHGFSVLAFTPADPHHAFKVARDVGVIDIAREAVSDRTSAYLDIAEDELGVASRVRTNIDQGVTIHTGALVDAERLASETSFRESSSLAMIATGTLAQGLNLPATAVVVSGTSVGDRRQAGTPEGRARAQAQLLNALGRASRPWVANHGIGIVVPERPIEFESPADSEVPRHEIPFLAAEDDSTEIQSRLRPLVDAALADDLDVSAASPEELVGYSYLPFGRDEADVSAAEILRRTYAISEYAGAPDELADQVADAVLAAGNTFLAASAAPNWLANATYKTGLSFFLTLRFQQARSRIGRQESAQPDQTVLGWLEHLFAILKVMPPDRAREMLGRPVNAEPIRALWSQDFQGDDPDWDVPGEWGAAWDRLAAATRGYIGGEPLAALADGLLGLDDDDEFDIERSTGDKPLPRLIAFANVTVERLSRLAGVLVACEELDPQVLSEHSPRDETDDPWFGLAVLPLAIRCGCGDFSSLAWFRFGAPFRRPAHMLGGAFPLPVEARADTAAREWVGGRRSAWLNDEMEIQVEGSDRLVRAVKTVLGGATVS